MLYRQALINYANKKGVTKAAIRYKTNRQYIYRWQKRYDGTRAYIAFYADKVKWLLNRQTQSMWQNNMNKCNFPVKEFK